MDRAYWTKKLRDAEAELEAATTRTTVNAAARKLQRAKTELEELGIEPAEMPKRSGGKRNHAAMKPPPSGD